MGKKKKDALVQFNQMNIINAAKILFEKNGIEATTMDEIAKEADCSKSTMYVYFKSKEEILLHIILDSMNYLKDLLSQCDDDDDDSFQKKFMKITYRLAEFEEQHPVFYELLLGEIRVEPQDIEEHNVRGQIYEAGELVNNVIAKALIKGMESGEVRKEIHMIETVFFLWSGISETIRFARKKGNYLNMRLGISEKDYMDYACGLFLRSIQA